MKILVARKDLVNALKDVGRVCEKRCTMPILSNAILSVRNGEITLTATNLETAIIRKVPGNITQDGEISIPIHVLATGLGKVKAEILQLECPDNTEENELREEQSRHYAAAVNHYAEVIESRKEFLASDDAMGLWAIFNFVSYMGFQNIEDSSGVDSIGNGAAQIEFDDIDKINETYAIPKVLSITNKSFGLNIGINMSVDDHPPVPALENLREMERFQGHKLLKIAEAASTEETRYNLGGIYMNGSVMVATDGHRMHTVETPEMSVLFKRDCEREEIVEEQSKHYRDAVNQYAWDYNARIPFVIGKSGLALWNIFAGLLNPIEDEQVTCDVRKYGTHRYHELKHRSYATEDDDCDEIPIEDMELISSGPITKSGGIIVPLAFTKIYKTYAKECPEPTFFFNNEIAGFRMDNVTIFSRLLQGDYPDYNRVIPRNDPAKKFTVNAEELMEKINQVAAFSFNDKTHGVKLSVNGTKMKILSENPEIGNASECIEIAPQIETNREDLIAGFNGHYLMETCRAFGGNVCVEMFDSLTAAKITSGEYMAVVMPMRI